MPFQRGNPKPPGSGRIKGIPNKRTLAAAAMAVGASNALDPEPPATSPTQPMLPHLIMPVHHDVRASDIHARTVKALAMVAEVVHGAPCRFSDPARFSLAHGGKDRHPYPVPLKVYDE
jgi:uncharacterized protein